MDDLFDFLMTIWDIQEIHEKYGTRGCILSVLLVVVIVAIIIGLAYWLGK